MRCKHSFPRSAPLQARNALGRDVAQIAAAGEHFAPAALQLLELYAQPVDEDGIPIVGCVQLGLLTASSLCSSLPDSLSKMPGFLTKPTWRIGMRPPYNERSRASRAIVSYHPTNDGLPHLVSPSRSVAHRPV